MAKIELNNPLIIPQVQAANSTVSGRGVFATKDFKQDELIEEAHAVLIKKPRPHVLRDYVFNWNDTYCAMLLGYGCVYNHSKFPNAYYRPDEANCAMNIFARRDIKAGEEIFITYGEDWFESHRYEEVIPSRQPVTKQDILLGIAIVMILLALLGLTKFSSIMGL